MARWMLLFSAQMQTKTRLKHKLIWLEWVHKTFFSSWFIGTCKLTLPLIFLKTFSFCFRQISISVPSAGMKAWGQFLNKKLKHIFLWQKCKQDRWRADRFNTRLREGRGSERGWVVMNALDVLCNGGMSLSFTWTHYIYTESLVYSPSIQTVLKKVFLMRRCECLRGGDLWQWPDVCQWIKITIWLTVTMGNSTYTWWQSKSRME